MQTRAAKNFQLRASLDMEFSEMQKKEKLPRRADRELLLRVRKALNEQLNRQGFYVVACSGGADSLALTDAMHEAGYEFSVCHVEHGLRGAEAMQDADFVFRWCAARGISCQISHVRAREYASACNLSEEDAARKLRYRALAVYAETLGADAVVTAHQRDDQAETVLLHLLRGSGLKGLAGMEPAGPFLVAQGENGEERWCVEVARPLLGFTGAELRAYCKARHLLWREDSTNAETRYTRNRVRRQLLPLLQEFNPNIMEALTRLAYVARLDAKYLREQALTACDTCVRWVENLEDPFIRETIRLAQGSLQRKKFLTENGADGLSLLTEADSRAETDRKFLPRLALDVRVWREHPPAIQLEILRIIWEMSGETQALSLDKVLEIKKMADRGCSGKKILLPNKRQIVYNYGKLILG